MSAAHGSEFTSDLVMFLAIELSASKRKVGTTIGFVERPREVKVEAGR